MATTVTYKGETLATIRNATKTLKTGGTWAEGDIGITDETSTAVVAVEDVPDSHGGIEKRITAVDISDTDATASDVAQGKVFYSNTGTRTVGMMVGAEWTTEGIVKRTEPNGAITIDGYNVTTPHVFRNCTGITSVTLKDTELNQSDAFNGCTGITEINCAGHVIIGGGSTFYGCTGLTDVYFGSTGRFNGTGAMRKCTNLLTARFPYHGLEKNGNETSANYCQMGNSFFREDAKLTLVDYGHAWNQFADCFNGCTALRTLILRRIDSVCGINSWSANAMGGIYNNPTESTIYVPQALISSYQTATNWSTGYAAGLTFLPIEGSEYEL